MKIQRLSYAENYHLPYKKSRDQKPQNHHLWHDHEELEFIQILKGSGSVCIGDSIQKFTDDDVFLIGSKLPHYWLFDDEYVYDVAAIADIKVIHFMPNFCGDHLLASPVCQSIQELYEKASKGILFPKRNTYIDAFFKDVFDLFGVQQVTKLLEILEYANQLPDIRLMTSENYAILHHENDYHRINKIMEYIRINYKTTFKLNDIATYVGMAPNSLCRYFKNKTGKTLLAFITEIRIATACKQLKESDISIKAMCYDCGFNNFVSFHKAFKKITGMTPLAYRQTL